MEFTNEKGYSYDSFFSYATFNYENSKPIKIRKSTHLIELNILTNFCKDNVAKNLTKHNIITLV